MIVYYELMYDSERTITTPPFALNPCRTYCHIFKPPSGLESIQLKKLRKGDLVKVSPVYVSASPAGLDLEQSSSAGVDEKGNPLFISVRCVFAAVAMQL